MNIFEMYVENGNRAGFWVRRNSWGEFSFGKVLQVQGRTEGPLTGEGPYYGYSEKKVFDGETGPVLMVAYYHMGDWKPTVQLVSGPGTYVYKRITEEEVNGLWDRIQDYRRGKRKL